MELTMHRTNSIELVTKRVGADTRWLTILVKNNEGEELELTLFLADKVNVDPVKLGKLLA